MCSGFKQSPRSRPPHRPATCRPPPTARSTQALDHRCKLRQLLPGIMLIDRDRATRNYYQRGWARTTSICRAAAGRHSLKSSSSPLAEIIEMKTVSLDLVDRVIFSCEFQLLLVPPQRFLFEVSYPSALKAHASRHRRQSSCIRRWRIRNEGTVECFVHAVMTSCRRSASEIICVHCLSPDKYRRTRLQKERAPQPRPSPLYLQNPTRIPILGF